MLLMLTMLLMSTMPMTVMVMMLVPIMVMIMVFMVRLWRRDFHGGVMATDTALMVQ